MLCLDTYALMELAMGNERFAYILHEEYVVPDCNLGELYYVLHRRFNEKTAQYWVNQFCSHVRPLSLDLWLAAARHRAIHHSKNLSFFDCLGYVYSIENGYRFVTGDQAFKNEKGVEYIK